MLDGSSLDALRGAVSHAVAAAQRVAHAGGQLGDCLPWWSDGGTLEVATLRPTAVLVNEALHPKKKKEKKKRKKEKKKNNPFTSA